MRTHTSFVRYGDFGPTFLPGPFTTRQIADNIGLRGPWKVAAVAWRLDLHTTTYTGKEATRIMKEIQGCA